LEDPCRHRAESGPLTIQFLSPFEQELATQALSVLGACPGLTDLGVHHRLGNRYGLAEVARILDVLLDRFHVVRRKGQYWVHGDGRPEDPEVTREWLAGLDRLWAGHGPKHKP
jgi:hypothetical protein